MLFLDLIIKDIFSFLKRDIFALDADKMGKVV